MSEDDLTQALAGWSASLQPHEHPPVILERLRTFSVRGLVPLDWADQEREHSEQRQAHLRELKALEARHNEAMDGATPSVRRHTPPPVLWAS